MEDELDTSTLDFGNELSTEQLNAPEPEVKVDPEVKTEPEAKAEPEVKTEPESKDEPSRDEKGRFAGIPKARFDEAVGKEREAREAAERRAAELERQLNQRQQDQTRSAEVGKLETTIAGLEKQHADFLLDGEGEKAAAVMKEIRLAERQIARAEAQAEATAATTQVLEVERTQLVIANLEAAHPMLNPNSEEYDADLVEDILDKQNRLMQSQGVARDKALEMAAKYHLGRIQKTEVKEEPKGLEVAAQKAEQEERKTKQVEKNLDTQKRQPASTKEVGLDSDKAGAKDGLPSMEGLSLEEYAALPEKTRARLRGDIL